MVNPTLRDTLITYCLRQLGEPVLEVNVDEAKVIHEANVAYMNKYK